MQQVPRHGGAGHDNFYRHAQLGRVLRRFLRLHPAGRALPDGAVDLFPHQRANTGQFERTLIIADKGSYVSYLEGCTAPMRDENQLHAAVVELVALDDAEIKYSTVQNWYPGDENGKGGIYNFVTKRGDCRGKNSKISWTQVETGSRDHLEIPESASCAATIRAASSIRSRSTNNQQADTGTKMIHLGKNTSSRSSPRASPPAVAEHLSRSRLGTAKATGARNFTQCDSLLIGDQCGAHTVPYIEAKNSSAQFEHEATTSKDLRRPDVLLPPARLVGRGGRGADRQRLRAARSCSICRWNSGRAQKLIGISLEGSVG